MSSPAVKYMLEQMQTYFTKVKNAMSTAGGSTSKYSTGSIAANGSATIDLPTLLEFTAAAYNVYSTGIQISIVDPMITTNPPVTGGEAVIRYEIQSDGKVILRNNYNGAVTYHARFTIPVKK